MSAATASRRYAGMRAWTSTYDAPKTTPDCSVSRCGIRSHAPKARYHEERSSEQRQMPPGGAARDHASQRIEREVARGDVRPGDAADREDHGRQRDPVPELEHRQPEQVEGDVAAEHRVGPAERCRVKRIEPRGPRRGRVQPDQDGGDEGGGVDDRAQPAGVDRDDARALGRGDRELAPPEEAERESQVEPENDEDDDADRGAGRRLSGKRLEEDPLVADLLVPEPVGVELSERRNAREDDERDKDQEEAGKSESHALILGRLGARGSGLRFGQLGKLARDSALARALSPEPGHD